MDINVMAWILLYFELSGVAKNNFRHLTKCVCIRQVNVHRKINLYGYILAKVNYIQFLESHKNFLRVGVPAIYLTS